MSVPIYYTIDFSLIMLYHRYMKGTLVNVSAVIIGSIIGTLISINIPERFTKIIFQIIGVFTLYLGVKMALKSDHILIMILSLILGAILGELMDIDKFINKFGDYMKHRLKIKSPDFSEGLITSFLLFCMGSMTILGAIQEGLTGKADIFYTKSVLDGISSIILSSTFGFGVFFSSIPLFLYQGSLTILASSLNNSLTTIVINDLTAVGGIILIALGIDIMKIKRIKVANLLPALVIIVFLSYFFGK